MKLSSYFKLESRAQASILRLCSADGTNRLTRKLVRDITEEVRQLAGEGRPLVIAGNDRFFS